jgi:alpha-tubulin suppressor-like RCC1 family protein
MTVTRVFLIALLLLPWRAASPGLTFLSVNPGSYHTCALADGGAAVCWGSNKNAQLGRGAAGVSQPLPQPVAGTARFTRLSAGANHNCGLTADGGVQCWGYNAFGQAGVKSPDIVTLPTAVASAVKFIELAAGFTHTCAIAEGGSAYCWGDSRTGQGGAGVSGGSTAVPSQVRVPEGTRFRMIGAGGGFSCGLTADQLVYCWGSNERGMLGTPVNQTCPSGRAQVPCATTPILVSAELRARYLAVGQSHTCAITTKGATVCWGGAYGASLTPVAEGHAFDMLAVGSGHTCGLEAGALFCWGSNISGKLGNGSTERSDTPVPVTGQLSFGSVRAGFQHTCAITTAQAIVCWGDNLDGQLGNAGTTASATPTKIVWQGTE